MLRIARHSEIAGETAPATPIWPDSASKRVGNDGRHIGLRYLRCAGNPAIITDFRCHLVQVLEATEDLLLIVLDPRGVDLFGRSHASLIERPLCLVCARQSNRRGLHDLTPSDTAGRYEAALRSDDAVNLIQNCAALKVRAVVEHKDWNSHERIVLANYVLCFEDEKLLKLERQFQDVQGHRNSTHIGREEIADEPHG